MLIPSFQKMGTGKIPYSSFKVQLNFPIQGLAVVVKNNFPIRGFATHGEIIFHYACKAFHGGNGNVPFVIQGEFSFPIFVASPLIWENPIPNSLQNGIGSFPCKKWKLGMFTRRRKIPVPAQKNRGKVFSLDFSSKNVGKDRKLGEMIFQSCQKI